MASSRGSPALPKFSPVEEELLGPGASEIFPVDMITPSDKPMLEEAPLKYPTAWVDPV